MDTSSAELPPELIERLFAGKQPSDKPFYCLSAGGACSGKSRPYEEAIKRDQTDRVVLIDPGIMAGDSAYDAKLAEHPHPEKLPGTVELFYARVEAIVAEATRRKISVIFEDHGDNPYEYARHVHLAKAAGYQTLLSAQTIRPEQFPAYLEHKNRRNNFRNMEAWSQATHPRFLQHFPLLCTIFDKGTLWQKRIDPATNREAGFDQVYSFAASKRQKREQVHDGEAYDCFLGWRQQAMAAQEFSHVDELMSRQLLRHINEGREPLSR